MNDKGRNQIKLDPYTKLNDKDEVMVYLMTDGFFKIGDQQEVKYTEFVIDKYANLKNYDYKYDSLNPEKVYVSR